MRFCFSLIFILGTSLSQGQNGDFTERAALIDSLYRAERYGDVIPLLEEQLRMSHGTIWEDSLHHYTYMYGRAYWKAKGVDAGKKAISDLTERIVDSDQRVESKLAALGDKSWLLYELGDIKECLETDSVALELALSSPGISVELLARAHQYLGFDYSMLGDYLQSMEQFKSAIRVIESADTTLKMALAEAYNGVGSCCWKMGRNKEAERYYLLSLEQLEGSEEPEMISRKASAVGNLALVWEDAGDLMKSKMYYTRNLEYNAQVIEASKDPSIKEEAIHNRSRTYANIAALYHAIGDYGTSRKYLDLAVADRGQLFDADHNRMMALRKRYAVLESAVGNFDKAEEYERDYLNVCKETYGMKSNYTLQSMIDLSDILVRKKEFSEAEQLLSDAIDMHAQLGTAKSSPEIGKAHRNRGNLYFETGHLEKAGADYRKARDVYAAAYGSENTKVVECLLALSSVEERLGNINTASSYVNEAYDLLELDSAREDHTSVQPHLVPSVLLRMVEVAEARGEIDMQNRIELLDRAISVLNRNRARLVDSESKLLMLAAHKKVFDKAQDLTFEELVRTKDPHDKQRVFALTEENKSVLLKSRLNAMSGLSFSKVPDSVVAKEVSLINAIHVQDPERGSLEKLMQSEQELKEFLTTLEREHPEYYNVRFGSTTASVQEVQESILEVGQTLLAYSFTDDFLYTIVIDKHNMEVVKSSSEGVATLIKQLNEAVVSRDERSYLEAAHEAYGRLIEPVRHLLQTRELLIIPDEELHYLNFELLITDESTPMDFTDNLLIQDFVISYLLSATTAVQFKRIKDRVQDGVLALAPGFSDDLRNEYVATVTDSAILDHDYLEYVQQPFAVSTAQELATLFTADVLIGSSASESAFRSKADKHGIIHFGTHAELNSNSPLYSKLVLGKELSGKPDDDGYLHAYEIYEMELNAELAVLTACQTGVGEHSGSEGVGSLAHSFAYAGCPSLVMSLWSIDEKTSSTIIKEFYEHLADGMSKNNALHTAKINYLNSVNGEQQAPFYWAGMVLVGDSSPIASSSYFPRWLWVAGLIALVVILFLVFRRNR